MKKVLYSSALVVLVAFSACKKDYTCECTTSDGQGGDYKSSVTIHSTKKDAESACSGKSSATSGGTTVTASCKIK
ncbi:hypothetical protein [Adhaeribacter terreus]|uniref:Lipoprotein n=1 Tax=Adhaeribacter terreus TaxID=529703 RepID=A0ABW0ECY9_9BACT